MINSDIYPFFDCTLHSSEENGVLLKIIDSSIIPGFREVASCADQAQSPL